LIALEFRGEIIMKIEYSEKEMLLIKHFGMEKVCERCFPPILYDMMSNIAFCSGIEDDYVKSLRRCMNALNSCKIYRMTKEFDDLIKV
jgi:hypothetical protein